MYLSLSPDAPQQERQKLQGLSVLPPPDFLALPTQRRQEEEEEKSVAAPSLSLRLEPPRRRRPPPPPQLSSAEVQDLSLALPTLKEVKERRRQQQQEEAQQARPRTSREEHQMAEEKPSLGVLSKVYDKLGTFFSSNWNVPSVSDVAPTAPEMGKLRRLMRSMGGGALENTGHFVKAAAVFMANAKLGEALQAHTGMSEYWSETAATLTGTFLFALWEAGPTTLFKKGKQRAAAGKHIAKRVFGYVLGEVGNALGEFVPGGGGPVGKAAEYLGYDTAASQKIVAGVHGYMIGKGLHLSVMGRMFPDTEAAAASDQTINPDQLRQVAEGLEPTHLASETLQDAELSRLAGRATTDRLSLQLPSLDLRTTVTTASPRTDARLLATEQQNLLTRLNNSYLDIAATIALVGVSAAVFTYGAPAALGYYATAAWQFTRKTPWAQKALVAGTIAVPSRYLGQLVCGMQRRWENLVQKTHMRLREQQTYTGKYIMLKWLQQGLRSEHLANTLKFSGHAVSGFVAVAGGMAIKGRAQRAVGRAVQWQTLEQAREEINSAWHQSVAQAHVLVQSSLERVDRVARERLPEPVYDGLQRGAAQARAGLAEAKRYAHEGMAEAKRVTSPIVDVVMKQVALSAGLLHPTERLADVELVAAAMAADKVDDNIMLRAHGATKRLLNDGANMMLDKVGLPTTVRDGVEALRDRIRGFTDDALRTLQARGKEAVDRDTRSAMDAMQQRFDRAHDEKNANAADRAQYERSTIGSFIETDRVARAAAREEAAQKVNDAWNVDLKNTRDIHEMLQTMRALDDSAMRADGRALEEKAAQFRTEAEQTASLAAASKRPRGTQRILRLHDMAARHIDLARRALGVQEGRLREAESQAKRRTNDHATAKAALDQKVDKTAREQGIGPAELTDKQVTDLLQTIDPNTARAVDNLKRLEDLAEMRVGMAQAGRQGALENVAAALDAQRHAVGDLKDEEPILRLMARQAERIRRGAEVESINAAMFRVATENGMQAFDLAYAQAFCTWSQTTAAGAAFTDLQGDLMKTSPAGRMPSVAGAAMLYYGPGATLGALGTVAGDAYAASQTMQQLYAIGKTAYKAGVAADTTARYAQPFTTAAQAYYQNTFTAAADRLVDDTIFFSDAFQDDFAMARDVFVAGKTSFLGMGRQAVLEYSGMVPADVAFRMVGGFDPTGGAATLAMGDLAGPAAVRAARAVGDSIRGTGLGDYFRGVGDGSRRYDI